MALPDLVAVLTAKTDGFETSLNRAAKAAESASSQIKGSTDKISAGFEFLKGAAAGIVGSLSVGMFVGLIKGAIDSADHLNDLSKKTGISVETLGGLGFAAEQSGGNLETMSAGAVKLNKSIAEAAAGNEHAKEGFDVLGVAVKDASGQTRKADAVLADIADRFANLNDGPEKTALAIRIFGKAGADMIAILDEGGAKLLQNVEYFKRYSGVTQELAEKSDQFNDTLTKLHLLSGAFGKQLSSSLLPTLQSLGDAFLEAKEKGTAFKTAADAIGETFRFLVVAGAAAVLAYKEFYIVLGGLAQQFGALAHLDFRKNFNIHEGMKADAAAALDEFNKFRTKIKSSSLPDFAGSVDKFSATIGKKDAERLAGSRPGSGAAVKVDDTDKKLLDQQLKELDLFIASERKLLQSRETLLNLHYQSDEVSIRDYFAQRADALQQSVEATKSAYQDEIAAVEDYIAKTRKKNDPKSEGRVIDAQTRLIELRSKLGQVEEDAAEKSVKDWFEQRKAVGQYADRLDELSAHLRDLKGDSAGAFKITFDIQNRDLRKKLALDKASNDPDVRDRARTAEADLAETQRQGLARAELNAQERERGIELGKLSNAQERVNIAVASGASTELQALADSSQANRDRIARMSAIVAAYERIAQASQDPQAIVAADRLKVELENLQSQTDLVADKFNTLGKSATENFIDKLASGTVNLKDAFKSLFADINSQLLKIASRNIAESLFGKTGALGDFGSIISKGIGGQGSSATSGASGGGGLLSSAGSALGDILSKLGIGSSSASVAKGAAGAGLQAGATGAFDISGSTGAIANVSKAAAANDAAFTQLTSSVTASDTAMTALSTTTPLVDTALSLVSTTTTTTLEAALLALETAATAAAAALSAVAASSTASSGSGVLSNAGYIAGDFLASAKGNIFDAGNVIPFARGGIVDRPTFFPMQKGGLGLMGEAGPEAIVPLKRGPDGRLGISAPSGLIPAPAGVTAAEKPDAIPCVVTALHEVITKFNEISESSPSKDSSLSTILTRNYSESTSDLTKSSKQSLIEKAIESVTAPERNQHASRVDGAFRAVEKAASVVAATLPVVSGGTGGQTAAATSASAKGNVFSIGNIVPFARGGIADPASVFPMALGGVGLMGEAGPEAIVPLQRGRDGRLGISASPDVSSVRQLIETIRSEKPESVQKAFPQIQRVLRDAITKFTDISESSVKDSSLSDITKRITESNTALSESSKKSSIQTAIESVTSKKDVDTTAIDGALRSVQQAANSAPLSVGVGAPGGAKEVSPSAKGNIFGAGNVVPFRLGGVVPSIDGSEKSDQVDKEMPALARTVREVFTKINENAFSFGNVLPFARGGIVESASSASLVAPRPGGSHKSDQPQREITELDRAVREVLTRFTNLHESAVSQSFISNMTKNLVESTKTVLNEPSTKSSAETALKAVKSAPGNIDTKTIEAALWKVEQAATSAADALSGVTGNGGIHPPEWPDAEQRAHGNPPAGARPAGGEVGAAARSAFGNIFAAGNVVPFRQGGVVSSPTLFPMANGGTGLMGEVGEEAILPLRRTRDGRLGVASNHDGGGGGKSAQNVHLIQNFLVQQNTPHESQQQFASAAFVGAMRAYRRNG